MWTEKTELSNGGGDLTPKAPNAWGRYWKIRSQRGAVSRTAPPTALYIPSKSAPWQPWGWKNGSLRTSAATTPGRSRYRWPIIFHTADTPSQGFWGTPGSARSAAKSHRAWVTDRDRAFGYIHAGYPRPSHWMPGSLPIPALNALDTWNWVMSMMTASPTWARSPTTWSIARR